MTGSFKMPPDLWWLNVATIFHRLSCFEGIWSSTTIVIVIIIIIVVLIIMTFVIFEDI